jgi:Domain of Unknown Function (DUF1080)
MRIAPLAIALTFALSTLAVAADPPKADPKTPSAAAAPKPPPPKAYITEAEAGPDFPIQGEYVGETGDDKWGLQVIALGKGEFKVVVHKGGLPGDGWDQSKKIEAPGKWEGDVVKFTSSENHTLTLSKDGTGVGANAQGGTCEFRRVVRKSPTEGAKPPEGAVVLFDGSSAEAFNNGKIDDRKLLQVGVTSKQKFGDQTIHIEFILPFMPDARGQGRANSGLYVQNRYELQILDSFGLKGENNECGGFYTKAAPSVNMCYPPLQWQTYDIDFTAAKFDETGKKIANAKTTVKHNGVVIHDNFEFNGPCPGGQPETKDPGAIQLQNHSNPVFFRNIWVVEKK